MSNAQSITVDEKGLIDELKKSPLGPEHAIPTKLRTDERVIARVTDGIYRQPASAIRELISNAYDADATRVVIKTDAPRFERISVEDNGHGMTTEALAHMIYHIGGSAKRQKSGEKLGITSSNPLLSPKGRKLIGKIGIGIFSVAQLTHTFQIITKVKGDNFRTIASVVLRQYADFIEIPDKDGEYESGKVKIWREKASDTAAHGTSIVLTNIRPQARDTLRSRDIWNGIDERINTSMIDELESLEAPKFHIGRLDAKGILVDSEKSTVPWRSKDSPDEAFGKLVNCVWEESQNSTPNTRLEKLFDYYLQMIWQLSLAIPLPYIEGHLFDKKASGWANVFQLSNEKKGSAKNIEESGKIRNAIKLVSGTEKLEFEVYFDGLKLKRPIKYEKLPTGSHALTKPLVFVGTVHESFKKHPIELTGGILEFEAYLFWNPKIVPVEHQGVLIRINGASGTLFDSSFLRYQVSEQTRLRQITCEIFIKQGFDSALNIDRESFNHAHPHAVYLTRWVHSALRQLATTQKRLASEIRKGNKEHSTEQVLSSIQQIADKVWKSETEDDYSEPPSISIEEPSLLNKKSDYNFNRAEIIGKQKGRVTVNSKGKSSVLEEKTKAITQVLASFGVLDMLSKQKQTRLLKAIYEILETAE